MGEGIRLADTYSQSLARALILLNNAGRPASGAQLAGIARQRLGALGIPEERTLNLVGQLGELGFSRQRIGQLVPALQNVEAGTGGRITQERALQMILRVIERPQQSGGGGRGGGGATRGLLGLATQLGVNYEVVRATGISEDVALLLAQEKGAELIVAVGTHFNLIEFLERNRAGMSSTFVTRLKVGEILIDAKGVSRLASTRVCMPGLHS